MMKFVDEGLNNTYLRLSNLKPKWDGYKAKKICKPCLDSLRDMEFISKVISIFRTVGFIESDIEVTPMSSGIYQFEAERDGMLLEIEITPKMIKKIIQGVRRR